LPATKPSIHTIAVTKAQKEFDQTETAAGTTLVKAVSAASKNESQAKAANSCFWQSPTCR
jgi:hypothetical protein